MHDFLKWTLDFIRKEGSAFSWMEERRLEWVPIVASLLKKILKGNTIVVLTDDNRKWFGEYVVNFLNKPPFNRPFLPFVSLQSVFPNIESLKTEEDFELLENMLLLAFANGYTFFYVGRSDDAKYQISKQRYDSFAWVLDEHVQNSFYLSSEDELLDIKLIQMFKLLNRSIDAVLFAEVSFED